jgi:hypothetical protein
MKRNAYRERFKDVAALEAASQIVEKEYAEMEAQAQLALTL